MDRTLARRQKSAPCRLCKATHRKRHRPLSWAPPHCRHRSAGTCQHGAGHSSPGRKRHSQARARDRRPDLPLCDCARLRKAKSCFYIRPSDILKATRKVNYARIDARELPALLRSIEVYQGTPVTRLAMKLLALTFVRTSELIGAKWSEFDLENARWDIPASRMKMRTPHIVPLARQTLDVLDMLHGLSGHTEWPFPGDRTTLKPISNNTILKALERMGYKGRMTGHGFRGLASTILHEQGYNHEHIELQLAHAPRNAVSAAYNHALYLQPRAELMQDWADYLERTQRRGALLSISGRTA